MRTKRSKKRSKNRITAVSFLILLGIGFSFYFYNTKLKNDDTSVNTAKENILTTKPNSNEDAINTTKKLDEDKTDIISTENNSDEKIPVHTDNNIDDVDKINSENQEEQETDKAEEPVEDKFSEVLLSFAGDCTIGTDTNFGYSTSLPAVFQNNNKNYSYFFKNVLPFFKEDDLTVVNLETTFTDATVKKPKAFNFKAPPHYAKILTEGSIEGVNIANNHIYDYNEKGFKDTKAALDKEGVKYFGEGSKWITTVNGQKFGFLGYQGWSNINLEKLKSDIVEMKKDNCIVVINFHWGLERHYYPTANQKKVARFSIDNGADLIIGHHPHVIQGIEQYKGKFIAYSLGNFCFGGNSNPSDKRTFILQTKFKFKNDEQTSVGVKVIPCSVSSVNYRNDYCPTPYEGEKKKALFNKLNEISPNAKFTINDDFFFIDGNNK